MGRRLHTGRTASVQVATIVYLGGQKSLFAKDIRGRYATLEGGQM